MSLVRSMRTAMTSRAMLARSIMAPASAARNNTLFAPATASTSRSVTQAPRRAFAAKSDMFCFQCEQTDHGTGCKTVGVCGKTPEVAAMQDGLVHGLKGLSVWQDLLKKEFGLTNETRSAFTMEALFSTLTNVNFDEARIIEYLQQALKYRDEAKAEYLAECKKRGVTPKTPSSHAANWAPKIEHSTADHKLPSWYDAVSVPHRQEIFGEDIAGVQEMITYGLKGLAAYATHARMLDKVSEEVHSGIHSLLAFLESPEAKDLGACFGKALEVGSLNIKVLELLDSGHTSRYGHPEPTEVNTSATKGKCILVSGHDMRDLEALLEQTKGTGINVYTHGEMLPAHSYPGLKKFPHLIGHYGGPWQLQKFEFAKFPGPIVMTTNCLVEPRKSYKDRIWTAGAVGFPDVKRVDHRDFSKVIAQAQQTPGFTETEAPKKLLIGFGHKTVLGVADKVIEGVTTGAIKRIHLIGGCDGAEGERSFYTRLGVGLPQDNVVLTLGCGKYRLNKHDFGATTNGIPRLLDMGQCNDSYSAVVVASALAKHFKTDVNGLPLDITLSWFEQKAVAVLLSLLSLGVKNITVGPNLPGFVTPSVLKVLVDKFNLKPIPAQH